MELEKCPQCGRPANPRSALCPFCGGRLDDAAALHEPLCPRCKVPLELKQKNDIEIDACPRCSGLWLDRGEFDVMTAESTVYREEKLTEQYSRPPLPESIEYVPCARCGKLMVRKNYARISGVMIDECGRHGVWLDSGELEKIRHFILDGGLQKEQSKDIEHIKGDLGELSDKVDDAVFMQKMLHFWNWKRWFFGP